MFKANGFNSQRTIQPPTCSKCGRTKSFVEGMFVCVRCEQEKAEIDRSR